MTDVQKEDLLCIPHRRRLVHDRLTDEGGNEVLHVFYGDREIVFDEPDLLPFGAQLVKADRFAAGDAVGWSNGEPYAWEKVRELLESLIDAEVVARVADAGATAPKAFPQRLGLAPEDRKPRTFSARDDDCAAITEEAFGRAVDLANLEAVIPVYRVAHPAMDTDGRQVGENNVVLRFLFLDPPTTRRVCNYAGDRCQAPVPMNVTALKNMTSRWGELLALTEELREAFVRRLPLRDPAQMTVGEVQLLSVCTLASAGYVMVRGDAASKNGELDAGLAGVFRLIDGVRLVTQDLQRFVASKHNCDQPLTPRMIASHAERENIYHGVYGVCAGPPALIDEYLQVACGETRAPVAAEPSLAARLGDVEAALDYGLIGQQIEATVRFFGASQGLLHERMRLALEGHPPTTELQKHLSVPVDTEHYPQLRDDHPLAVGFEIERAVSSWTFDRVSEAVTLAGVGPGKLGELLDVTGVDLTTSRRSLRALVDQHAPELPAELRAKVADIAAESFALERRALRLVVQAQHQLNARLQRPNGRRLTGEDLALYTQTRFGLPLSVVLARGLGVPAIVSDAESTVISVGDHPLVPRRLSGATVNPDLLRHYRDTFRDEAALRFGVTEGSLAKLPAFENFVYEATNTDEAEIILRLSHSARRTADYTRGEVEFVRYLAASELPVAAPVLAESGQFVEVIDGSAADVEGYFVATAFERAPGYVFDDAPALRERYWQPPFFEELGRIFARLHDRGQAYRVSNPAFKRQQWWEYDVVDIDRFAPREETLVRERTREILDRLKRLPTASEGYGLIHADIHAHNFCFDGNKITLFDFDNAEYAWFVKDIAVMLFYVARNVPAEERDEAAAAFLQPFLAGYREQRECSRAWLESIPDMLALQRSMNYALFHQYRDPADRSDALLDGWRRFRRDIEGAVPVLSLDFGKF